MIFNLILSLIILAISGCNRDIAPVPLKFKGYEGNPVLSPGEPGAWDDLMIALPNVVKHDSTYYLFYLGINNRGIAAMGLATSTDGYHFTKYHGNPIMQTDGSGPDAFGVGAGIVIRQDSVWLMYYNSIERATWGPGGNIGRATAAVLTGPWIKDEKPVLTAGKRGEWDSEYLFPNSVLTLDDGSFRMYYSGGADFSGSEYQYLGMASSRDGIYWKKHNDPATKERPFSDSDPVLKTGNMGEWDSQQVWTCFVQRDSSGYEMYYGGNSFIDNVRIMSAGYATSDDGLLWKKFHRNPVFEIDKSLITSQGISEKDIVEIVYEGPSLIFADSICLMYYDYAIIGNFGSRIGVAKAGVK